MSVISGCSPRSSSSSRSSTLSVPGGSPSVKMSFPGGSPSVKMSFPGGSPTFKLSLNESSLLRSIQSLRTNDPQMLDVTFVANGGKTIRANSTILALRSNYFKNLFFPPLPTIPAPPKRNANSLGSSGLSEEDDDRAPSLTRPRRRAPTIPPEVSCRRSTNGTFTITLDVDPEILMFLLHFADGTAPVRVNPDESNDSIYELCGGNEECYFTSALEAFKVRKAAKYFQFKELTDICSCFIFNELSYSNAIDFLVYASDYMSLDLKPRILKTLTNRGDYILANENENIRKLSLPNVEEIFNLFRTTQPDLVVKFLLYWGADKEPSYFQRVFRESFYPTILWAKVSKGQMHEIHQMELLTSAQENLSLLQMMNTEESETQELDRISGSTTEIKIRTKSGNVNLTQIVFRIAKLTGKKWHFPIKETNLPSKSSLVALDSVGVEMLDSLLQKCDEEIGLAEINVNPLDVKLGIQARQIKGKVWNQVPVQNMRASAFRTRKVKDVLREECLLIKLSFDPLSLSDIALNCRLEMDLALLKDLVQCVLTSRERVRPSNQQPVNKKGKVEQERLSYDLSTDEKVQKMTTLRSKEPYPTIWVPVLTHIKID